MIKRAKDKKERPGTRQPLSAEIVWARWSQAISTWLPYFTLATATILSLIQPGLTGTARLETLAWVALAAAWVFLMYTRAPEPRLNHPARMIVYFAGLLAFATVLMSRQAIFFVFTITGFFHAAILRPWPLMVMGVAATSILTNTVSTGFPWSTIGAWSIYLSIIFFQTLAIGFGTVVGERMAELSEQRKQAVARLEAALVENAGLHAQLLAQAREAGVLEERQRLAREIHDTLAQGLIGIITQLEAARQAANRPGDWQRHHDHAVNLARESLAEARRSVKALRPEPLESARLPDALVEVAQQWSAMNGVPVETTTCGDPIALHPEIEASLLRTAQEALANIARHANASRAGLTLSYMGDVVTLDIRDDGDGFELPGDAGLEGEGFGLITMRQRVNRVAGTLEIESEPGGGTAVSARVPAIPAQAEVAKI
jgi:signal transduction histidine kinase